MVLEEIVDLAVRERAEGSEVTARLVRLADWTGHDEWRREWRGEEGWCSCPIPEATARAILGRATTQRERHAA